MDFDSLDFFNAFEPSKLKKTKPEVSGKEAEPTKEQEVVKVEPAEPKSKPKTQAGNEDMDVQARYE